MMTVSLLWSLSDKEFPSVLTYKGGKWLIKFVSYNQSKIHRFTASMGMYTGMVGGLMGARNDGILEIIGSPSEYREDTCTGVIAWVGEGFREREKGYLRISLLPKVTEQLIKYLKNEFVVLCQRKLRVML